MKRITHILSNRSFYFWGTSKGENLPIDIMNHAKQYYLAGNRCKENRMKENGVEALPYATLTNYSFACELYFKAFCKLQGKKKVYGHELNKLYHILDSKYKNDIEKEYRNEYSIMTDWIQAESLKIDLNGINEIIITKEAPELNALLLEINRTYDDSRYNFETSKGYYNETALEALTTACYKLADLYIVL